VRIFEVDRASLLLRKEAVLETLQAKATCSRIVVPADITADLDTALSSAGMDASQPAIFVLEGVLSYREPDAVRTLVSTMRARACPGSCCVADVVNHATFSAREMRPLMRWLEGRGSPWIFSVDAPEEFFDELGWASKATLLGSDDASFGRWPWPPWPDSIRDAPRTYFVHGSVR
jgi:methyltransferase (TIGR00027 family)